MHDSENILWKGKPSFASFLGLYLLYSLPFLSFLAAQFVWNVFPGEAKIILEASTRLLEKLLGLPYPLSIVYLMGFFISIILCVLNWLLRVDMKPLIFTMMSYLSIEVARLASVIPGEFSFRLFLLFSCSLIGVLGVELYRKSFAYSILKDSVVIKGGFLRKWERIVNKKSISDVVIIKPVLGHFLGFAHVVPITQSQIGLGDTFSLGAVKVEKKTTGVIVGGGKTVVDVEPRPWNCIYGVKDVESVKRALLE